MPLRRCQFLTKFLTPICVVILSIASSARANPTQDEVFRSINQNVGSTVDLSKVIPYVMLAIGAVIMVVLYNHRSQRKAIAKPLNHPGKLLREIAAKIDLKPVELQQLKMLAQAQQIEFPLTLLLCPSTLGKAMRASGTQADRQIIQGLVQRLRDGMNSAKSQTPSS
jgi:hypothetical protein